MSDRHRDTPPARTIHGYWCRERPREAAEWFGQVDAGEPSCYGCRWYASAVVSHGADEFVGLDRSHLVDFAQGGTDELPNLVLLCPACNRDRMPVFRPHQYDSAVEWVRTQPHWHELYRPRAEALLAASVELGRLPTWFSDYVGEEDPTWLAEIQRLLWRHPPFQPAALAGLFEGARSEVAGAVA